MKTIDECHKELVAANLELSNASIALESAQIRLAQAKINRAAAAELWRYMVDKKDEKTT